MPHTTYTIYTIYLNTSFRPFKEFIYINNIFVLIWWKRRVYMLLCEWWCYCCFCSRSSSSFAAAAVASFSCLIKNSKLCSSIEFLDLIVWLCQAFSSFTDRFDLSFDRVENRVRITYTHTISMLWITKRPLRIDQFLLFSRSHTLFLSSSLTHFSSFNFHGCASLAYGIFARPFQCISIYSRETVLCEMLWCAIGSYH